MPSYFAKKVKQKCLKAAMANYTELQETRQGRETVKKSERLRFDVPLYTFSDVAGIVGVKWQTTRSWTLERPGLPALVTMIGGQQRGHPRIPFVGLAEALVLAAVRSIGVPMQRVRPALEILKKEMGIEHALANKMLHTDGVEILVDFAEHHPESDEGACVQELVVIRHGQRVFHEIVEEYLQRIEYADDKYASRIKVGGFNTAEVFVDPKMSFGQPIFKSGGARVGDVLERIRAGEELAEVAADFRVPVEHVEDAWNVAENRAA